MNEDVANFIKDLSQRDFVVFAGAGIVGDTGVPPSWKKLLEAFKEDEPSIEIGNLDKIDEYQYPEIAQKIYEALDDQKRKGRYFEILKRRLQTTNSNYSSPQFDIVDTARHVVTTNYDDTFEHAMHRVLEWNQGQSHATQSLPELRVNALTNTYSVSYLHGRVNEECLVFKNNDYRKFYPSQFGVPDGCDNLERFLRYIYEERTIVFVGFSFWDNCFLKAIQEIHSDLARNDAVGKVEKPSYLAELDRIKHYALLPEPNFEDEEKIIKEIDENELGTKESIRARRIIWFRKLEERLPALNIKILSYKKHKEWTEWFRQIRDLRSTKERG
jgi:hypothetical protein